MKKVLSLLLCAAMMVTLASCAEKEPKEPKEPERTLPAGTLVDGRMEWTLSDETATIHGRYAVEPHAGENAYAFSHGAAGFAANFTGTDFWMYVPEVPTENNKPRTVEVAVVIDSEMAMDATMVPIEDKGWIQLASGLSEGDHHIEVRKRDRSFYGMLTADYFCASKIAVNEAGTLKLPDLLSDFVIEVYGDSISNGDAVWKREDGSNCSYTYGNWTGVLERLLDAEVRVTANTGNGLLGWILAQKNGKLDNLYPPQKNWNKVDPHRTGDLAWSHEGNNAADVVIINLGTNDRVELGNGDLPHEVFEDEYIRFIKEIRTDCPDAMVIATVGAMGSLDSYGVDFNRICSECNTWAGKDFVFYLPLDEDKTITGGPAWDNGHPSNLAGEIYGLQLANMIKKYKGLDTELPDDIPVSAFTAKVSGDVPQGNLIEYCTKKTDTISRAIALIP